MLMNSQVALNFQQRTVDDIVLWRVVVAVFGELQVFAQRLFKLMPQLCWFSRFAEDQDDGQQVAQL